jgi:hypothetical protein
VGAVNMTGKDRVEEMQARTRLRRAAALLGGIKRRGEAMREVFAKSSCDLCAGQLVRHDGGRGFVCENGHAADVEAAKRRHETEHSARMKAVDREREIIEARALSFQAKAKRGRA